MVMKTRKYDALHNLLNAVVMGIGQHKPTEFHIVNVRTQQLRFVKGHPGGQTVLPVLDKDERYETVIWNMGGGSTSYDYRSFGHFGLSADTRQGGLSISAGGDDERMYQSPYGLIGVYGTLKRAAYGCGNVITTPTVGMAAAVIRGMIVAAYDRHAELTGSEF
jgi:hypothetical protein